MADEVTPEAAPVIQEFPKMLYHAELGQRIVAQQDDQDALGAAWSEVPGAPPAAPEPPTEPTVPPEPPEEPPA
jgi:hypothetical protein